MIPHYPLLCAFDLETTGANPDTAKIVTVTVMLMDARGARTPFEFLADPGVEIPAEAERIHGVSTEYARQHGRPLGEVVSEVCDLLQRAWMLGIPVVAFNAAYDFSVLKMHNPDFTIGGLVLDPHVIDKSADRYRKGSRTLTSTAAHYDVDLAEEDAHTSLADARAAGEIVWKQFSRASDLNVLRIPKYAAAVDDAQKMMAVQVSERRQIQRGLGQYLHRVGKVASPDEVDGGWPFQDSTLKLCAPAPPANGGM